MTVHAAKGLEFPVVFIAGLEENLFPSQFCVKPQEIEEERRLLYVAITRAMERCYLSFARQRFRNGQMAFNSPSRFLNDVKRSYSRRGSIRLPSGDRVTHRVFGDGTVVRVYRDEVTENDKIEINFDTQGTKTLLLTHAKLEKI